MKPFAKPWALANVPDVYGWLRLDRRGQWLIKDETIANVTVRDFISRNYLRTDGGAYAFQNGPQRVFVELDYAPWVVSLQPSGELRLHTGTCEAESRLMDEAGALLYQWQCYSAAGRPRPRCLCDWLVAPTAALDSACGGRGRCVSGG